MESQGFENTEDADVAVLHELGHIRLGHFGYRDSRQFVRNGLEANQWTLTTQCGYPQEDWDWSLLLGIAEDLASHFGLSLKETWSVTKSVVREMGVSSSSLEQGEGGNKE